MVLYRDAIGYAIRTVRLEQGHNLRHVSDRAHVSLGHLSEVERGIKEPSSEIIGKIAESLDMTTSELILRTSEVMSSWEQQALEQSIELELAHA